MNSPIERFISAHEYYLQLDRRRSDCRSPQEREVLHIEILKAYLDVQHHAKVITGIQTVEGMDFARVN
jgi:hypothetical protein